MARPDSPVAQRLRRAIDASGYSIRGLAAALAERADVSANAESVRRSLGKWLAGDPLGAEWSVVLEDQLELKPGVLYEPDGVVLRQRSLEREARAAAARLERAEAQIAKNAKQLLAQARTLAAMEARLAALEPARGTKQQGQGGQA